MKLRIFLFLVVFINVACAQAQTKDVQAIRAIFERQATCWNRGDIECFMDDYWKSDSLLFIGKSGVKWGWQTTLNNYKKSYPDTAAMGKLSFELIQVKQISSTYYYVVGKWLLKRVAGDLSGHYDLLLRKIKGRWYIVADHSS